MVYLGLEVYLGFNPGSVRATRGSPPAKPRARCHNRHDHPPGLGYDGYFIFEQDSGRGAAAPLRLILENKDRRLAFPDLVDAVSIPHVPVTGVR